MFCCLKWLPDTKERNEEVSEDPARHVQSQETRHDVLPQPAVPIVSRTGHPPDAIPAVTEPTPSLHRSSSLKKVGSNNSQQTNIPLRTAIPSVLAIDNLDRTISVPTKPSRDLWKEAFAKLGDEEKDLLSKVEKREGSKIVEEIERQTKARYREHEERGWKMPRGKGKGDISLRTAARKILASVLWAKDLIDRVIAFDATGYASIAWSIVSFGLQMIKNDMDRLESIFEACGTLTDILTLCAAIDASHRDERVPDTFHLEEAIIFVYVVILKFATEVFREKTMTRGQNILSSINSLEERSLHEFLKVLYSKEKILSRWTQVIQHQYRKGENEALTGKVDDVLASIEDLAVKVLKFESQALTDEEDRILRWFSEYRFFESQREASLRRDASTAAWILDSPKYKDWKESGDNLLWLYGRSGCGKSVLCSRIIEDLRELCDGECTCVKAYWYFNFNIQDSLDFGNFVCSLIRQLCNGTKILPDKVREHWKKHRNGGPKVMTQLLPEVLDSVVSGLERTGRKVFIVLDALDEFPLQGREDLLRWLQSFCEHHNSTHVLITSRDETEVREALEDAAKVNVAMCVVRDVEVFIEHSIEEIVQKAIWKARWKGQMHGAIERISDRRFRWASLMKDTFSNCLDDDAMDKAVKDLPDSVEAMYAQILTHRVFGHANKSNKAKARLIFIWLAHSLGPLTLWELACAVSLADPRKVLEICTSSLVTLQQEGYRRPELESEEHLLASGETAYFYASPLLAHLTIAEFSVDYLLRFKTMPAEDLDYESSKEADAQSENANAWEEAQQHWPHDLASWEELWPQYALLAYSAFWYEHVQQADVLEMSTDELSEKKTLEVGSAAIQPHQEYLRSRIHRFFCDGSFLQNFKNWKHGLDRSPRDRPSKVRCMGHVIVPPSSLWLASLLKLPDNVRRLLQSGEPVDGRCLPDTVRRLFQPGKPYDERVKEFASTIKTNMPEQVVSTLYYVGAMACRPVQIAAWEGSLEILELLLENNAILEQEDFDRVVCKNRWNGPAVLSIMLKARPHLAVTHGTVETAKLNSSLEILEYIQNTPDLFDRRDD